MRASTNSPSRRVLDVDFGSLLKNARRTVEVESNPGDTATRQRAEVTPYNQRGGRSVFTFDLGDARFTAPGYIEYSVGGTCLIYSVQGSVNGGVLDFDFDAGGQELYCIPGAKLNGPFSRVLIKRNAASVSAGAVQLRIQKQPDVTYEELARGFPSGTLGNPSQGGVGPAGATTQAYNSAAGNIPTAATDGISLAGAAGVRAIVKSNGATTITPAVGALVWWQYSTADAAWGETDFQDIPSVTRNIWIAPEKEIWVPEGRVYCEARSMTNSGGAGAFTMRLATWGA